MKNLYSKIIIASLFFAMVQGCASSEQKSEKAEAPVATKTATINTPDEALEALIEGNNRFVSGKCDHKSQDLATATSLTKGQSPFAVVIGCSDSRVPAEILFNQGFGDLFVVRNAGNSIIDHKMQGSMDYGANHITSTKLIVVLGHSDCGAITSIVNHDKEHAHEHAHASADYVEEMLGDIIHEIPQYEGSHELNKAIKANVDMQVKHIKEMPYIAERIASGDLKVIGACYNIADGKVTFYR